jgi:hypothetical protein
MRDWPVLKMRFRSEKERRELRRAWSGVERRGEAERRARRTVK